MVVNIFLSFIKEGRIIQHGVNSRHSETAKEKKTELEGKGDRNMPKMIVIIYTSVCRHIHGYSHTMHSKKNSHVS